MISKMKEYLEAQIAQVEASMSVDYYSCCVDFDEGRLHAYRDALKKLNEQFPPYQTNIIKRDEIVKLAHDVHNMQEECRLKHAVIRMYQEGRADAFAYVGNRLGEILNDGN